MSQTRAMEKYRRDTSDLGNAAWAQAEKDFPGLFAGMTFGQAEQVGQFMGTVAGNLFFVHWHYFREAQKRTYLWWLAMSVFAGVMTVVSFGWGWGLLAWFVTNGVGLTVLET